MQGDRSALTCSWQWTAQVREAPDGIGVEEFTESGVIAHSRRMGHTMTVRGAKFVTDIVEKVKLEIIAADDAVGGIIEAIGSCARTGRKEDCRIAIRSYLEVT